MLLRLFQSQVKLQCEFMLLAANQANEALRQQTPESNIALFSALQSLLGSAANISKALWGAGSRFTDERKELRESIGVEDSSPLHEVTMRNNFEHFDERLTKWWDESTRHNYSDLNVGPRNMIQGLDDLDTFRNFDPRSADLFFWGQTFNVQALVNEIRRILPKATEESEKPHWDTSTSG